MKHSILSRSGGTDPARYLFDLGHFHKADDSNFVVTKVEWEAVQGLRSWDSQYQEAVCSYQQMRGLKEDGNFGDICFQRSVMETGCRCGLPDIMERRANLSEWPPACQNSITTAHQLGSLRYSGSGSIDKAWDWGLAQWNQASGVVLSRIDNFSSAKIRATADRLSSGILAWSYLPNNNCREWLKQSYNNRVSWFWRLLGTTSCHEVGHAIGLSHGGRGIMQPANDSSVTGLDSWDTKEIRKRYGLPTDPPEPPEPPLPPVEGEYGILQWYGKNGKPKDAYDVMKREFKPAS